MKHVRYDRGRPLKALPEIVACLWSNWEIYDAVLNRRFNITRIAENAWTARSYFNATLTLVNREASIKSGRFFYELRAAVMGIPGTVLVTLTYELSATGTYVHGEFKSDLSGLAQMMEPLVRGRINDAINAVIDGGQESCEAIANHFDQVAPQLSSDHRATIARYLTTAARLRDGKAGDERILTSTTARPGGSLAVDGRVFIVHGRNHEPVESVSAFLRERGCEPIVLRDQPNVGRTLIEKFVELATTGYAVVLLTPDDRGGLLGDKNYQPRARQNVVFEMGYFIGRIGRGRVCVLHREGVELPSDLAGIMYVPLDDSGEWKKQLLGEMQAVGVVS